MKYAIGILLLAGTTSAQDLNQELGLLHQALLSLNTQVPTVVRPASPTNFLEEIKKGKKLKPPLSEKILKQDTVANELANSFNLSVKTVNKQIKETAKFLGKPIDLTDQTFFKELRRRLSLVTKNERPKEEAREIEAEETAQENDIQKLSDGILAMFPFEKGLTPQIARKVAAKLIHQPHIDLRNKKVQITLKRMIAEELSHEAQPPQISDKMLQDLAKKVAKQMGKQEAKRPTSDDDWET